MQTQVYFTGGAVSPGTTDTGGEPGACGASEEPTDRGGEWSRSSVVDDLGSWAPTARRGFEMADAFLAPERYSSVAIVLIAATATTRRGLRQQTPVAIRLASMHVERLATSEGHECLRVTRMSNGAPNASEHRRTAYHESGHAVVAAITHQLGDAISIVGDEMSFGRCVVRRKSALYRAVPHLLVGRIHTVRLEALILLGAYAGEMLCDDQADAADVGGTAAATWRTAEGHWQPHVTEVSQLADEFMLPCPERFVTDAVLAVQSVFSRDVVKDATCRLAAFLLAEDTLSAETVRVVVAQSMGSKAERTWLDIFRMCHDGRFCPTCGRSLWWAAAARRYCSHPCRRKGGQTSVDVRLA